MCGIAGLARVREAPEVQHMLVERMCARLAHRGPDGGGLSAGADATLGLRRLAVVDVAGGAQPMHSDDGAITLAYNGEVYNAPALRAELVQAGVRFHTRSDTEVILRLYERNPDRVEEVLEGMWAFAIRDRRRNRLVLSRDRFGIKPLFVMPTMGGMAFASELTALEELRARDAAPFALDAEAAHAMLAWSYVPGLATIYTGVRRLAPGTRLEYALDSGTVQERTWWQLTPSAEASRVRTLEEAVGFVEPILARAVREHLESDVPIAAFLSGGIDSALVAAMACAEGGRPVTAVTVGMADPRFDESAAARAAGRVLGIEHRVVRLDEAAARRAVAETLLAFDEPFGDSSGIATWLLSRTVASLGFKVALAGDGGDEAFAGYRKHRILAWRARLDRVGMREGLGRLIAQVPARTDRTGVVAEALRTLARVARGLAGDEAEANAALSQVVSLARVAPLLRGRTKGAAYWESALARYRSATGTALQRTLAADLGSPLANDMLAKVDRTSMAVGLEVRVPFLDHRVVEAGLGLPASFTLPGGKRVLRRMHEARFGPALARRRKQGFGVPVEAWLRGWLAPACDALFAPARLEAHGLLAPDALADGRWRRVAATDPQVLWHALALAAWCEARIGSGADGLRDLLRVDR